jgi:leucyl/phenylalanyl-tRNA--protein transferase
MGKLPRPIPWLLEGDHFPSVCDAWANTDPAPGLLAAGSTLEVDNLIRAYSQGIFPWFSLGQPVLWWSPDPRMVLDPHNFRLHRSLRKRLVHFRDDPDCEIRIDHAFGSVIEACATKERAGQNGTWIVPEMVSAYRALNHAGHAHSIETWIHGRLAGALYCVNLGRMVFGESMFAHETDASKIAVAALVAFCLSHGITMIDCQQNTSHLASLGATEITRERFVAHVAESSTRTPPGWRFDVLYWNQLLPDRPASRP